MMMNWILGIAGACVGSLFIYLPVQEPVIHSLKKNIALSSSSLKQQTDLSEAEVCDRAEKFTIKILSENRIAEGTGILIEKKVEGKQLLYTVLTNDHVVRDSRNYQVQTIDNILYPATLIRRYGENSSGNDLAILQFNSKSDYEVATFRSASTLERDDIVFAAGFPVVADPSVPRGFECKSGEISLILDLEMELGYKVGYFVDIEKGMSGGPLLNSKGEVVGINGKHSHPLPFGTGNQDPYVYKDGSTVDRPRNLLENSSWAIPIEKLREKEYVPIINIYIADSRLPEQVPESPESIQQASKDPERTQLESTDPPEITRPESQAPGSTPQPGPQAPGATEPVLQPELEDRASNCPSNISTLQQSKSEPIEDLFVWEEGYAYAYIDIEKDGKVKKVRVRVRVPSAYVKAKMSCQEGNCSLEIIRNKDNNLNDFNIPIKDRGEVFDLQVQDLDNSGENSKEEPEVIVSFIEEKEGNNCYSLVYRYHGNDIGYQGYRRPIYTSNSVEEGED